MPSARARPLILGTSGCSTFLILLLALVLDDLLVRLGQLRVVEQVLQRQELLVAEVAIEMFLNFLQIVLHI